MDAWTYHFDAFMKRFYGIDHRDAGMDDAQLARYRDLSPEEAAKTFGEDYDLDRIDRRFW
ncbi:hypothetical protein N799_05280 [Lysobacter arseniciresistens ZS79]|uniref:Uncharacterized protein n=1 Tax=Lysobacter arseniciresistens ZS79 TaxID=913325 RepID=A0A0A0F2W3_9GAMM|nr:hypothetical protein [Lysobacter arseniciresistens]KGM57481.1 hypothetical protein N799_05280 [Lysobacter arseniciresistens ZS79]